MCSPWDTGLHRQWLCNNAPHAHGRRDQGAELIGPRALHSMPYIGQAAALPSPFFHPASALLSRRLRPFCAAHLFPPPGDIYDIIDALEAGYGNAYSGDDVYDYPGSEYELEVVQRDTRTLVAASRAWRAARGAAGEGGEQEGVEVKRGGSRGGRAAGGRGRAASATWSDVDPDPDRMALKLGLQGEWGSGQKREELD